MTQELTVLTRDDDQTAAAETGVPATTTREPERARDQRPVLAAAVLGAHLLLLWAPLGEVLTALLGGTLLLALPWWWVRDSAWLRDTRSLERSLYAVGVVVMGIFVVGLAINLLLPWASVDRPLARTPVVLTMLVVNLALVVGGSRRPLTRARLERSPVDAPTIAAVMAAATCVVGAIRLNNGAGPTVAVLGLTAVAALLMALLVRARHEPDPDSAADAATRASDARQLWLLAAAVLLATSLRGWDIVGHDIQREWLVYTLTMDNERWIPALMRDAYNACLSLTVLPAVVAQATGITGPALYKVGAQLLFAVTPVAIYVASRRFLDRQAALLGTVVFIAFPTFINDMPMLVRQEVAFVFLALAVLAATEQRWPVWWRRVGAVLALLGVVLAHYSTTYVLLVMLASAGVAGLLLAGYNRLRRGGSRAARGGSVPVLTSVSVIATVVVACLLWTGPVTQSSSFFRQVVVQTYAEIFQGASSEGSSDLAYRLFAPDTMSAEERLAAYDADAREEYDVRQTDGGGDLIGITKQEVDLSLVDRPVVDDRPAGDLIGALGLDPVTVTSWWRQFSALLLQLMLIAGVGAAMLRLRGTERFSTELRVLGFGAVAGIGVIALVPSLSVSYGLLRVFQQALLLLAPIVAVGLLTLLRPLRGWARGAAIVVMISFFVSLSGVATQVFGGERPQLNTSSTGEYVDRYYSYPAETSAMDWLNHRRDAITDDVPLVGDYYLLHRVTDWDADTLPLSDRIHPLMITNESWLLMSRQTVLSGEATVPYSGDQITFTYPLELVDEHKDRVYDNGEARVYR